jgi:hypothetical protein
MHLPTADQKPNQQSSQALFYSSRTRSELVPKKKKKSPSGSTSRASRVSQVRCADLITTQVGSFFFLCFGPGRHRPVVSPFEEEEAV